MKKFSLTLICSLLVVSLWGQRNTTALHFDGKSDYVDFPIDTQFNPKTSSFSIQLNFVLNDTASISTTKLNVLLAKGMSSDNKNYGYALNIREHNGKKVIYAVLGSNNNYREVYSKTEVDDHQWYNVAAVYDRSANYLKLYVNGNIEDSISISTVGTATTTWPLQIGRFYWPTKKLAAHHLDGALDNAAYWRKALNAKEVKEYASCPPTGKEKDLFGYWNFETGSGTKIIDRTSNKNDGNIHGSKWSNVVPLQSCNLDTCQYYDTTYVSDTLMVNDTITHFDTSYVAETRYGQVNRSALNFDGLLSYVSFDSNAVFNVDTRSFTIQMDYKPRNMGSISPTNLHMLLGKGMSNNQNNYGYTVNVRPYNGKNLFYAVLGSNNNYREVYSQTEPENDKWYNVAAVYDRGAKLLSLYINGQLEDTVSIAGIGNANTTWPLIIGKYLWADTKQSGHYTDGTLDNIAFWNKALTEQQVNDNMKCLVDSSNDLRSLWKMEGAKGSTILDQSNNGLNGHIHDATWTNVVAPQICRTDTCGEFRDTVTVTVRDTLIYSDTTYTTIYDTITHQVYDTVIIQRFDTTFVSVQDTLIFTAKLTGVSPPNNLNTIKVYPNPVKDHLIIDMGNYNSMQWYTVLIKNNVGQTVFSNTVDRQQFVIDLNTWTGKGLYFLHIIDSKSNTIAIKKIGIK